MTRINYWSCSKLADWLRGENKPYALGWDEWDEWRDAAKAAHPFRYWLAEEALDFCQNVLWWPRDKYDNIRYYVRNRFRDRMHMLPTRLEKGVWWDLDSRLLHGCFESLVDFVEVELHCRCWDTDDHAYRSRERGLKYLDWEESLVYDETCGVEKDDPQYGVLTHQAEAAKITRRLYLWWKDIRPNRPEPYDFIHEEFEDYEGRYGEVNRLEKEHDDEDTAMLKLLIEHRHCLWT